jgi:uncharacterized membrane protein
MTIRPDLFWLVLGFGFASLACRIGGFWLMRFVSITPKLEAALKATPLAVMVGIVAPAAAHGSYAEILALLVIAALMRFTRNDLISGVGGMATVALWRMLQFPL